MRNSVLAVVIVVKVLCAVFKVYATDRDAGDNARIAYRLQSDPSGFFAIDSHTGWVTVARPMTGVTSSRPRHVFTATIY